MQKRLETHTRLKTWLKMVSGERRKHWHKYLLLAIPNYNTSYHKSVGSAPNWVFYGRVPYNILDHKLRQEFNPHLKVTTDFADDLLQKTIFRTTKPKRTSHSHTSNIKSIMTTKQQFFRSKKKTLAGFSNLKQIPKDQKSYFAVSDGIVHI